MSLARSPASLRSSSLAAVTALGFSLFLLLAGCAADDRAAPPTDGTREREEIVELRTELEVDDVGAAVRALRSTLEAHDGHVETSDRGERAHLVVRVPIDALDVIRVALDELDADRTEYEQRLDVTRTHADLGARLRGARATEERLLGLLADRTATLADVLAAERELARVRTEIEIAEAEERVLVDRVREASIDVTILAHAPAWRDEPIAAMGRALSGGIEATWSVLVATAVTAAAFTPALVLLALLVLLVLAIRATRRALRRRGSPSPT